MCVQAKMRALYRWHVVAHERVTVHVSHLHFVCADLTIQRERDTHTSHTSCRLAAGPRQSRRTSARADSITSHLAAASPRFQLRHGCQRLVSVAGRVHFHDQRDETALAPLLTLTGARQAPQEAGVAGRKARRRTDTEGRRSVDVHGDGQESFEGSHGSGQARSPAAFPEGRRLEALGFQ